MKIDLKQTQFATEDELKKYLIALVVEYTSTMNEIENYVNKKSDAEPRKDFFPEFRKRYLPIFDLYCSDKKRVYGGKANSYGIPTKFDGIENSSEQSVEIKNKNRAEAYFKTQNDFDAEYWFVLVRKNDVWRIDNAKYRWYGNEKWNPMIL